jgi:hypothetical protein
MLAFAVDGAALIHPTWNGLIVCSKRRHGSQRFKKRRSFDNKIVLTKNTGK